MNRTPLSCGSDALRRKRSRKSALYGLDFVELGAHDRELVVHFLGKAPAQLSAARLAVEGGRRVRDVRVTAVRFERSTDPALDDRMIVELNKAGDASTYQLRVLPECATDETPADFDPRYDRASFTFGLDCAPDLDCAAEKACPDAPLPSPAIDYLAKDYATFRQVMLDRLSLLAPKWRERHVPDVGITLVELIAYAADRLSYYQDAVATEAYLDTSRLRVSLRRHLRLVDYVLHEGCNARAWLACEVSQDVTLARDTFFAIAGGPRDTGPVLTPDQWRALGEHGALQFEPVWPQDAQLRLRRDRNAIRLYTWQGSECCLPKGVTRATLIDPGAETHVLELQVGDVLIFEEVKSPTTGLPADADPSHRHAVRLTRAAKSADPLADPERGRSTLLWEIEWCEEDALPFSVCVSSVSAPPKCAPLEDVSIVRGNVFLVDHGATFEEELGSVPLEREDPECASACSGLRVTRVPKRFRPQLSKLELTHAEPIADGAAATMFVRAPERALPQLILTGIPAAPSGEPAFTTADLLDPTALAASLAQEKRASWLFRQLPKSVRRGLEDWARDAGPLPDALRAPILERLESLLQHWMPRPDLLGSGPDDRHVVVEVGDDRRPQLRFGDGDCGAMPPAGMSFRARYRSGAGPAGNVGAGAIRQLVFRNAYPSGIEIRVRNPLPAAGGTAFESADRAKLRGPHVFRRQLERAITAADYAAIAMREFPAQVQRAAADLRWTGSTTEVRVAIDALAAHGCDPELLGRIERRLSRYRRIGHVVRVVPAARVPLRLELHVCVDPSYVRGHIRARLLDLFGTKQLRDGTLGFFHPDRLSFGNAVYVSQLVALARTVSGVNHVKVTKLERYWEGENPKFDDGLLELGPLEVAQLDSDPLAPERGELKLMLEGGR